MPNAKCQTPNAKRQMPNMIFGVWRLAFGEGGKIYYDLSVYL
jgi:hypothetical protein